MPTDLKYLLKNFGLTNSQKRLLGAITREPSAHLYLQAYMTRHYLTRGGIASGLRRLKALNLVIQENGVWQTHPPELRKWYQAVMAPCCSPEEIEKLRWAELEDPFFWKMGS